MGNLLQKSRIQIKNTYQENKEINIFNDVNLTFIIRIKSFFHIEQYELLSLILGISEYYFLSKYQIFKTRKTRVL